MSWEPTAGLAGQENPYQAPQAPLIPPESPPEPAEIPDEDLDPFRTIWTRPRQTVRWLVAKDPELHVVLLTCLGGIGSALDRASMRSTGDTVSVSMIFVVAFVLGPLLGLFGLWAGSHLIRWAGSWIGGTAERRHVRTAMAWASVPSVAALPLWIPSLLFFGSELFTTETPRMDAEPWLWIPMIVIGLLEIVLGLWALILLCQTIAEVQGFKSGWAGFGNLLLAGAVVAVPLVALVVAVLVIGSL